MAFVHVERERERGCGFKVEALQSSVLVILLKDAGRMSPRHSEAMLCSGGFVGSETLRITVLHRCLGTNSVPVEWSSEHQRNEARFALLVTQMQKLDPGGVQPVSKLHPRC